MHFQEIDKYPRRDPLPSAKNSTSTWPCDCERSPASRCRFRLQRRLFVSLLHHGSFTRKNVACSHRNSITRAVCASRSGMRIRVEKKKRQQKKRFQSQLQTLANECRYGVKSRNTRAFSRAIKDGLAFLAHSGLQEKKQAHTLLGKCPRGRRRRRQWTGFHCPTRRAYLSSGSACSGT